jgi:opacity protein-like surface antigen
VHEAGDPLTFIEFEEGFAANGALGYRFNMFRVEAEYSFMNQETEFAGAGPAQLAGIAPTAATGNVNLKALMFNLYHDIDLPFTFWRPYLGAGIGIYQSEINSLYPEFFGNPALAAFGFNTNPVNTTSDMPFAYQFRAGASRSLGERTEFFTGYRYFKGEELTFASAPFASPLAPTFHPDGAEVHSVEFGLRVRF